MNVRAILSTGFVLFGSLFIGCDAALDKDAYGADGGAAGAYGPAFVPDAGLSGCLQTSDCPSGLTCQNQQCVASDGLPPENTSAQSDFLQPQTSANFVFTLSPTDNTVAVINSSNLSIRSIGLPPQPAGIQVIPGQDSAVIVEQSGASVSWLSCTTAACNLQSEGTTRQYPAVSVSQDGAWAILWTPYPLAPAEGAEGVVAVVDVSNLSAGTPVPITERSTGREDTNAFFRVSGTTAVDAVVVGEQYVAVMELSQLSTQQLPLLVPIPTEYTSVDSRQTTVSADGAWVVFQSFTTPDVGVFDVANRVMNTITLPSIPTGVALSSDGTEVVAVLRASGQVGYFPIPGALTDSSLVQVVSASLPALSCGTGSGSGSCTASPGQAVISNNGAVALLFTNAVQTEAFNVLDLASGAVSTFSGLAKIVNTLGIGPDDNSVIVLHTPLSNSTASDAYQQMVDTSQGYSVVNLAQSFAELTLTQAVPPQFFVFSTDNLYAGVTLSDGKTNFAVDTINLSTLVTASITLPSPPQFAGSFNGSNSLMWVAQQDTAGRISFVDLSDQTVRTATGYALNGGISP